MDGVRPVDSVKTEAKAYQRRVPSHKSHPRAKFTEPLTPLKRLARFKEIRDRNLARDKNLRKVIQNKRQSLAHPFTMEAVVNGVGRGESKLAKIENVDKLSNGTDAPSHTNGVEKASNGNGLNDDPVEDQLEVVTAHKVGEKSEKSPKRNGTVGLAENAIDSTNEVLQEVAVSETVDKGNVHDAGNDSDSEAGHESEGSSLDVVGESSSESLDLQLPLCNSGETSEKPSTSQIPELAPAPEPDEPEVFTPEIVRRIRAGGRIAVRRNLRGDNSSSAVKRKLDDDELPSLKKARDDGTARSPGWQFFSPSKSLSKFWTPFLSSPKTSETTSDANESMIVNVDEQSNIMDKINEETATTLIEESQETHTPRWCAIM